MEIVNSKINDLDLIFSLYEEATLYQKRKFHRSWQPFSREMVIREINEGKQFKIISEGEIVGIFAVAFNDPLIWKEKDLAPSIYLHRIVSHSDHKGKYIVKDIIKWSVEFAKVSGFKFIRLDTFSDNTKLVNYYKECGFNYVGEISPEKSNDLPDHYSGVKLALLEIAL